MLFLSAGMAVPSAAFPQYLGELGASVAVVGLILSLRGLGNLISDLPGGILLGRVGFRPVTVVSVLIAFVASLVIWLVRDVATIGVLTLVSGASVSLVVTGMMTHVRATVPPDQRGRALSLVGGSLRIGMLIGPLAGGVVADTYGTQTTFLLKALCTIAALIAFVAAPAPGSEAAPVREPGRGRLAAQIRAVSTGMRGRWKALAAVGGYVLILMIVRSSRNFVLPQWGASLGLKATVIGMVLSAGAAMDFLLFVPAGAIMDRAGRKVAGSLCIGVFSVGLAMLALSHGVIGFVVASMLIGVGNGFGAGINMTLGTDIAPSGAISEFLGIWRFMGDIGQTSGPAIVGGIAAVAGLGPGILAIAVCGFLGLGVLVVLAPETLHIARQTG